jgi:hypothetical protein
MQTIHIDVADNKVDILLNIIQNLKEGIVEGYSVSSGEEDDPYFESRRARLHALRDAIKEGKEPLQSFSASTEALLKELQA